MPGAELHHSEGSLHQRQLGPWRFLPTASDARTITVVGENYRLDALFQPSGDPAVIWLPQLEGTSEASELMLRMAAARGMAALALVPPRNRQLSDQAGWFQLAAERVRAGRAALWLVEQEVRPRCLAIAGLSLGGYAAVAVSRLEPSSDVLVTMLAGSGDGATAAVERLSPGNLPPFAGIGADSLLLPRLPPSRTLVVRALWDDLIPPDSTDLLAEALEHPAEHEYPSGHESFRSFLPIAIWRALGFVKNACASAGQPHADSVLGLGH